MDNNATDLDSLLDKVRRDTGHDFRDYKRGTVIRRLERRLLASGAKTYPDYMRLLDAHLEEYERLIDYLTICDSLASPGYLILGEAEAPTSSLNGKLECLDNKAKIYKKAKINQGYSRRIP